MFAESSVVFNGETTGLLKVVAKCAKVLYSPVVWSGTSTMSISDIYVPKPTGVAKFERGVHKVNIVRVFKAEAEVN